MINSCLLFVGRYQNNDLEVLSVSSMHGSIQYTRMTVCVCYAIFTP